MTYSGPRIGVVLQAAAERRKRRQRKNFMRGSRYTRANWINDLFAFAAIGFVALIILMKGFGL
jgi:hypothetical protein